MKKILGLLFIGLFMFSACSDQESRIRHIQVRLTDSPASYDAVYIDIQGVQVHTEEGSWVDLNTNTGVYNLLELTNGIDTVIVEDQTIVGDVSQIRLILGDDNSVVVSGEPHDLKVPSGSQSGLKLNVHESMLDGITYKILLDFDAGRSVVEAGNSGQWLLKPVIRTIVEAQDGAIEGVVLPEGLNTYVRAIQGEDTLSTYANDNGYYMIRAVPGGSYEILFDGGEGYEPASVDDVDVIIGQVTVVETVTLEETE